MIEIEIDGIKLDVPNNTMIIEAADNAGIYIPRFCYHRKLTIVANCRTCLVEVEKVGKPLPACATPVSQGMRIFTRSPRALEAQRAVMEFLLINHPLDCPICDQGGECELQDISMGYGSDYSRFSEGKRAVADEDLGSLIESEMTRCIQCTRCVRFGEEIVGMKELGAMSRGEHMEIGTYVKHMLSSELSGNIIDLCPVGALTSKPFRFTARAWELNQVASIAPHDAVGSNLYIHTRRGQVMRIVPHEKEEINETWISDRDRFSYAGIYHPNRLETPMIKVDGVWQTADWHMALEVVTEQLQRLIQTHGATQLGAIASPSATLEECYLFQKLWRVLGSPHIDHRLHATDFSDQAHAPLYPGFNTPIAEIENKDTIFFIGSHIHHEQPLIAQRMRKASLQGAKIIAVNPVDFSFNFPIVQKSIVHPFQMAEKLAAILYGLNGDLPTEIKQQFPKVSADSTIAKLLKESQKPALFLGAMALNHPQASLIRFLAQAIAKMINATYGEFTEGGNAAGAWLAGCVPHRGPAGAAVKQEGKTIQAMFAEPLKGYLMMQVDPAFDCANPQRAMTALAQAEFVVALTAFKTPQLMQVADVLLPATTFAETSGTFVNGEGRWQSFTGSVKPFADARPTWKILRVLANLCAFNGFDYQDSEAIKHELQSLIETTKPKIHEAPFPKINPLAQLPFTRITTWPIYRGDTLVRHSEPLQNSVTQCPVGIYMNLETAQSFGFSADDLVRVTQGKAQATLPLFVDAEIPNHCVFIPAGYEETSMLGENFGEVSLHAA